MERLTNTKRGDINTKRGDINTDLALLCICDKIIHKFVRGVTIMNVVKIEENKNNLVVKHKDLVWEARYKLSELGIKVVAVLISMVKANDEDFKEYILKIDDFKELIDSNSKKVYEYVDIMTNELMSKPFKIGDEKFNWVYYARYHEGDNYVVVKIAPELKPYLLALKSDFIEYNITNILPLKSSYVIRLYELLKSKWREYKHYNKLAKSYTFELKIDWIREHFQIPASYRYNDVKRIIQKAQKQFKQKTDIQFEYKEQKIGRKVDRLVITVKDNNKGSNDYLANRKAFVAYVREKYKPDPVGGIFPTILETDKGDIKVDLKGNIYLATNGDIQEYTKEQADKLWDWLYEMAQAGNLIIQM